MPCHADMPLTLLRYAAPFSLDIFAEIDTILMFLLLMPICFLLPRYAMMPVYFASDMIRLIRRPRCFAYVTFRHADRALLVTLLRHATLQARALCHITNVFFFFHV